MNVQPRYSKPLWRRITSAWARDEGPETEPVSIDEVLQMELAEQLLRAGLKPHEYEARFTRASNDARSPSGRQEFVAWIRPGAGVMPTSESMLGMEAVLDRKLRVYGIRISAVFWRLQGGGAPDARERLMRMRLSGAAQ
jgi:hypothetical protein